MEAKLLISLMQRRMATESLLDFKKIDDHKNSKTCFGTDKAGYTKNLVEARQAVRVEGTLEVPITA